MTADLRAITSWKTWHPPVAEDDGILSLIPNSNLNGSIIGVLPYSAVGIRIFGKNSAADTAIMQIVGRMDVGTKVGSGPPQSLWKGQIKLTSSGTSGVPLNDNKWGSTATWFDVDVFDIAGASAGHNAANSVILSGSGDALMILPTLGYSHLVMHFSDVGGGGTEMTEVGSLYREIAMGGVV